MKSTNLLWGKIKNIKVAMLITVTKEGGYHSRPMTTLQEEYCGKLHFLTPHTAPIVEEILSEPRVLLNYTMPEESIYVSVYGEARIIKNQELSDPELCQIEVDVVRAEYWDAGKNKMVILE